MGAELSKEWQAGLRRPDVDAIRSAKHLFLLSFFIPPLAYYTKGIPFFEDSDQKFPATISWTIRRGLPKYLHHLFWINGWVLMLRMLVRRFFAARSQSAKKAAWKVLVFGLQMFCTGVVSIVLYPVGQNNGQNDRVHFIVRQTPRCCTLLLPL